MTDPTITGCFTNPRRKIPAGDGTPRGFRRVAAFELVVMQILERMAHRAMVTASSQKRNELASGSVSRCDECPPCTTPLDGTGYINILGRVHMLMGK
ncbi:MAG: hypothetical protein PGN21_12840 [Sphingomonas paucimobilis]